MKTTDLYDPINDAPFARFEAYGDNYSGTPVRYDMQSDKYNSSEQILVAILQLAEPTADGDDYAKLALRSEQLRREYGRNAQRAGRAELDDGVGLDWVSVTYVEDREAGSGNTFKWYDVDYKTDVLDGETIGDGVLGEYDANQPIF
jgi:hypothetical protein